MISVLSLEKNEEIFTLKTTELKIEFRLVSAPFVEAIIKRGIFFYSWPKRYKKNVEKLKKGFKLFQKKNSLLMFQLRF